MISIKIFQSTLPREERHSAVKSTSCPMLISIHAPTRGATIQRLVQMHQMQYFNPRSHERSDYLESTWHPLASGFQSTLPREERQINSLINEVGKIFQSTLPREERRYLILITLSLKNFNPRSHERSDINIFLVLNQNAHFNPRSHERSDGHDCIQFLDDLISIHAPTRGATVRKRTCGIILTFQSTLPREERPC